MDIFYNIYADMLCRAKKNDWQREKATLELKIDTKAREVQLQQESIDRKNQEVSATVTFVN